MRDQKIDDFFDRWNERRLKPSGREMFGARTIEREQALPASQRLLFRQLIGSFLGRFRPDRRSFRQRLDRCPDIRLDDSTMAHALEEMGVEALKRHLSVALEPDDAERAVEIYQITFAPPEPQPTVESQPAH